MRNYGCPRAGRGSHGPCGKFGTKLESQLIARSRLFGKLKGILQPDLPNCVCPLGFSRHCMTNLVCRCSVRQVSGYGFPLKGVTVSNIGH
ncbi:hypothetical protein CRG98_027823 [Punica granatum]|uniref:Uncharacterized protein n=1 Tax=Punica granatum TaxID=22663 RepID=A0A2I0J6A6_PUNGR|nr:hypothetical protein CRG98_027823 [Punica granatum]